MSDYLTYYNVGMVILIAFLTAIIPKFTRKDLAFGVTIPESLKDQKPIKNWINIYIAVIALVGVILFIVILIISIKGKAIVLILSITLGGQLMVYYGTYFIFHRKLKQLKAKSDWKTEKQTRVVVDLSVQNRQIRFRLVWYVISFMIILVTVLIPLFIFDQLPNQLAIHYNEFGQVDQLMDKGTAIYMMPLSQFFITIIMVLGHIGISRSKVTINPEDKEGSASRQRTFRTRMAMMLYAIGLTMNITFLISQLFIIEILKDNQLMYTLLGVTILVMFLSIIIIIRYTGQSGWKLDKSNKKSDTIKRDDDRYYKLGIVYFNPHDPALFVEKRFGIGWTFNFGNPVSWVLMIAIIVMIIILV